MSFVLPGPLSVPFTDMSRAIPLCCHPALEPASYELKPVKMLAEVNLFPLMCECHKEKEVTDRDYI